MKRNSTSLKHRLEGKWLGAFSALAPQLKEAIDNLGHNVPCPVEGGVDGFRLFSDAPYSGGGVKQSVGVIPEGIGMLMFVNNWDFKTAFDELESWLGTGVSHAKPLHIPKPKAPQDTSQLRYWLNNLWYYAKTLEDINSFPARAYFKSRWIYEASCCVSDVRYHPCLPYKDKDGSTLGRSGVILGLVRNNQGAPVQLDRLFISSSGQKMQFGPGLKPKKRTPPVDKTVKGRHIRLFKPVNGYLGVSEGLETALAVYQVKKFPVWPNLSATNLQSFEPPKGIHTVVNFVDKDRSETGENSAEILKERLAFKGINVVNLLPPTPILDSDLKGVDWADQLIRDPSGFDVIDQFLPSHIN